MHSAIAFNSSISTSTDNFPVSHGITLTTNWRITLILALAYKFLSLIAKFNGDCHLLVFYLHWGSRFAGFSSDFTEKAMKTREIFDEILTTVPLLFLLGIDQMFHQIGEMDDEDDENED